MAVKIERLCKRLWICFHGAMVGCYWHIKQTLGGKKAWQKGGPTWSGLGIWMATRDGIRYFLLQIHLYFVHMVLNIDTHSSPFAAANVCWIKRHPQLALKSCQKFPCHHLKEGIGSTWEKWNDQGPWTLNHGDGVMAYAHVTRASLADTRTNGMAETVFTIVFNVVPCLIW